MKIYWNNKSNDYFFTYDDHTFRQILVDGWLDLMLFNHKGFKFICEVK